MSELLICPACQQPVPWQVDGGRYRLWCLTLGCPYPPGWGNTLDEAVKNWKSWRAKDEKGVQYQCPTCAGPVFFQMKKFDRDLGKGSEYWVGCWRRGCVHHIGKGPSLDEAIADWKDSPNPNMSMSLICPSCKQEAKLQSLVGHVYTFGCSTPECPHPKGKARSLYESKSVWYGIALRNAFGNLLKCPKCGAGVFPRRIGSGSRDISYVVGCWQLKCQRTTGYGPTLDEAIRVWLNPTVDERKAALAKLEKPPMPASQSVEVLHKLITDLWNVRAYGINEAELWNRVCVAVPEELHGVRPVDEHGVGIMPQDVIPPKSNNNPDLK